MYTLFFSPSTNDMLFSYLGPFLTFSKTGHSSVGHNCPNFLLSTFTCLLLKMPLRETLHQFYSAHASLKGCKYTNLCDLILGRWCYNIYLPKTCTLAIHERLIFPLNRFKLLVFFVTPMRLHHKSQESVVRSVSWSKINTHKWRYIYFFAFSPKLSPKDWKRKRLTYETWCRTAVESGSSRHMDWAGCDLWPKKHD